VALIFCLLNAHPLLIASVIAPPFGVSNSHSLDAGDSVLFKRSLLLTLFVVVAEFTVVVNPHKEAELKSVVVGASIKMLSLTVVSSFMMITVIVSDAVFVVVELNLGA
jgi:hypothetical protein